MTLYLQAKSEDRLHGYSVCRERGLTDMISLICQLCFSAFSFQRTQTVGSNSRTPTFTASLPHYIGHKLTKRQRETHLGPEDQVLKGCFSTATAYIFVRTCLQFLKLVVIILTRSSKVLYILLLNVHLSCVCLQLFAFLLPGGKSDMPVIAVLFLNIN